MVNGSAFPQYVGRGGEQVGLSPYGASLVRLYCFILPADPAKLNDMLARFLNEPSGGVVRFRTPYPFVLLYFADIGEIRSTAEPDRNLGTGREVEVAFLIFAQDERLDILHTFAPYMFVDSSSSMASGRELYGFPKQIAQIAMHDDEFLLDAYGLRNFGPQAFSVKERLIHVRSDQPLIVPDTLDWGDVEEARANLASLADEAPSAEIADFSPGDALASIFDFFIGRKVRMVFLKQFRDITFPARACYQAVTECGADLRQFYGGGVVPRDQRVTVTIDELASHPIVSDLGLDRFQQPGREPFSGPVELTAAASAWLAFDFELQTGSELWRAPVPAPAMAETPGGGG